MPYSTISGYSTRQNTGTMEDWLLIIIIVVPICVAILAVTIAGCLCMRYWKKRRARVGTAKTCYVNHGVQNNAGGDVESQRRASLNNETVIRTGNEILSQATVINEERVPHSFGIGVKTGQGNLSSAIFNDQKAPQNFGTGIQFGKMYLPAATIINEEKVSHNFGTGVNNDKWSLTLATIINEQRATQRSEEEGSTGKQQKQLSQLLSTHFRDQIQAEPTHGLAVTRDTRSVAQPRSVQQSTSSYKDPSTHGLAVTRDTRSVAQPSSVQQSTSSYKDPSTHGLPVTRDTRYVAQPSSVQQSTSSYKDPSTHGLPVTRDTRYVAQPSSVQQSTSSYKDPSTHGLAVTRDTRSVAQPSSVQQSTSSYKDPSTHGLPVTRDTRYVAQPSSVQQSTSSYKDTSTGYPTLDLHHYTLRDAMAAFKQFLRESITDYKDSNYSRNKRFALVITGRGLHSRGGIPVIKPAVENYLIAHDYTYNWSNPGLVRIDLVSLREWD